jgi:hypothetical protein
MTRASACKTQPVNLLRPRFKGLEVHQFERTKAKRMIWSKLSSSSRCLSNHETACAASRSAHNRSGTLLEIRHALRRREKLCSILLTKQRLLCHHRLRCVSFFSSDNMRRTFASLVLSLALVLALSVNGEAVRDHDQGQLLAPPAPRQQADIPAPQAHGQQAEIPEPQANDAQAKAANLPEARAIPDFEPTDEWQVIKPGQRIPPGLWVRMDMTTGIKTARLLEKPAAKVRSAVPSQAEALVLVSKSDAAAPDASAAEPARLEPVVIHHIEKPAEERKLPPPTFVPGEFRSLEMLEASGLGVQPSEFELMAERTCLWALA